MEINKISSTSDRPGNLREVDGKPGAKQADAVRQDGSRNISSESTDKTESQTKVQLSSVAQVLREATDSLSKGSDVDLSRVQEIRSAIEEGTYHVDPQRLAASFLDLENQLFS